MEIFVDNISSHTSSKRDRPSVHQDYQAASHNGAEVSFRDELAKRLNTVGSERSALGLQPQFMPIVLADRTSYVMASNAVNKLRVRR